MKIAWKKPRDSHIIYEALSALADGRLKLIDSHKATCESTSRGKSYEIEFDPATSSIMSNDNMAYYAREVSYPMAAMFLIKEIYAFDKNILHYFKDIRWKDINQKNGNNYMKSVDEVLRGLEKQGVATGYIKKMAQKIYDDISSATWYMLGERRAPPNVY